MRQVANRSNTSAPSARTAGGTAAHWSAVGAGRVARGCACCAGPPGLSRRAESLWAGCGIRCTQDTQGGERWGGAVPESGPIHPSYLGTALACRAETPQVGGPPTQRSQSRACLRRFGHYSRVRWSGVNAGGKPATQRSQSRACLQRRDAQVAVRAACMWQGSTAAAQRSHTRACLLGAKQ